MRKGLNHLRNQVELNKEYAKTVIKTLAATTGAGRIVVGVALDAFDKYFIEVHLEAIKEYNSNQVFIDLNNATAEIYNALVSDLKESKRVMIIAHSQGNLFADRVLTDIKRSHPEYKNSIGIVSVATPAAGTPHNNDYVTAHDDLIIKALSLINTVLRSNINNDPGLIDRRDVSNHYFLESYYDPTLPSYFEIKNMMVALRSRLIAPPPSEEPSSLTDNDNDGLENDWEVNNGLNPDSIDSDGDGKDDFGEVGNIDSPYDTDNDGTIDALETSESDPCIPSVSNNACRAKGIANNITFNPSSLL